MRKKYGLFLVFSVLLFCACNEAKQDYFNGVVIEISDNKIMVQPDESEEIYKTAEIIELPKEVVSENGLPELGVGSAIRVLYNNQSIEDINPMKIEIVYAIYLVDENGSVIE